LAQLADDDVLKFAAQSLDRADQEVVRQWPGRFKSFDAAVDARRLENADQDWERPRAGDFFEIDHLLIVDLANDDPRQFHRDGHGGVSLVVVVGTGPTLPLYSRNNERRVAAGRGRSANI